MTITIPDIAGLVGTALLVIAYFLMQRGTVKGTDYTYLFLNLIGAGLILVSLFWDFNLSAFVIESIWVAISLYGILKKYKVTKLT